MQKMAKAQFVLGLLPQIQATGGDPKEVMMRVLEAVDTEDIDKIYPPQPPPDPMQAAMQMEHMKQALRKWLPLRQGRGRGRRASAKALKDAAEAAATGQAFELWIEAGMHGMELGAQAAHMESAAMSMWSWFDKAFDVGAAYARHRCGWSERSKLLPAMSSRLGATIPHQVRHAPCNATPTNAAMNGSGCRGRAVRPINASSTDYASARTRCSASLPITRHFCETLNLEPEQEEQAA
jgi:hypothetical protein